MKSTISLSAKGKAIVRWRRKAKGLSLRDSQAAGKKAMRPPGIAFT